MKRIFIAVALTITATAAILATASCTRSSIVIESPESMGCINMSWGNLEATKVIIADTATTVCFRMKYRTDKTFCFVSNSYLRDEVGNRYPLRSAVGIKLDDIISMPDSVFEFTMNFEPLPRKVQVFDFIEGDVDRAFMLLGIHDKKIERNVPTFKQLSAKNRFTVPDDWFKTDTITIRGRIEGYDAEKFGFSSMECYLDDVFAKNIGTTIVLDIAADGSFEKRFVASSPIVQNFVASYSKVNFYYLNFFACPGETIDITVKPDESGGYECFYNTGSSKEVERFLKTEAVAELNVGYIINELYAFNGCFDDAMIIAEKTKQNLALQLAAMDHSNHFSPLEMQLALAEKQINYVFALTTYLHNREQALLRNEKIELDNGNTYYSTIITDSVEYEKLLDVENYSQMHCIDFDNPLLMTNSLFLLAVSRLQILKPVKREGSFTEKNVEKWIEKHYDGMRGMSGCDHDNLVAQICGYIKMQSDINACKRNKDFIGQLLEDKNIPDSVKQRVVAEQPIADSLLPHYLAHFTNPYIRQKAEQCIANEMAQTEPATPLPNNNLAADFIRSFNAKYPGRILVFDFWGMGCGPCRAAIEASKTRREEIAKRTDVKLIFVAAERTPEGSEQYKKYVAEWLAGEETVCVLEADFAHLADLFGFNGIPHSETITPDGRRVSEDLKIEGLYDIDDYNINRLKEKLK